MNTPKSRLVHAAVAAILQDMDRYLPSETIQRADYRRVRQLYGLMNTAYRRIDASTNPEKEYKELQALEWDLRRRFNDLHAAKGIPAKMTQYLNELKNAVDDALVKGLTTEPLIQGIIDVLEDRLNAQSEVHEELANMIPDTKYKKARAELGEARSKAQKFKVRYRIIKHRAILMKYDCTQKLYQ